MVTEKEQILAYLNKCIEINPTFMKAYINKAAVYRDDKKDNEAIDILNNVISPVYNEDFLMAVQQRGISYRLTGKLTLALNDFNFVSLFLPENIQNISNLAITHLSMGHYMEALSFGNLGLEKAKVQNRHFCDAELNFVINQAKAAVEDWENSLNRLT